MTHGIPDPKMVAKYGYDMFKNWEPDKPSAALELIQRPGPFRASPAELEMMLGLSLSEVQSWSPAQIRRLGSAFCLMGYDARGNILRDLAKAIDKDDGERFLKYLRECNP